MVRKSEPGVIRTIRTACKALSKHGSEQSGVYQPFIAFLKSHGICRNPLIWHPFEEIDIGLI